MLGLFGSSKRDEGDERWKQNFGLFKKVYRVNALTLSAMSDSALASCRNRVWSGPTARRSSSYSASGLSVSTRCSSANSTSYTRSGTVAGAATASPVARLNVPVCIGHSIS